MLKSFFLKILSFAFIFGLNPINSESQNKPNNNNDTLKKDGTIILRNKFSKRFCILMQDTSLQGNRFDYRWFRTAGDREVPAVTYTFPAFIVDTVLAVYCDSLMTFNSEDKRISLTSWPERPLPKLVKRYHRLFIGFIDDEGNRNIVIQFVSSKDFRQYKNFYLRELFLVVPRKELHFAVINIGR